MEVELEMETHINSAFQSQFELDPFVGEGGSFSKLKNSGF